MALSSIPCYSVQYSCSEKVHCLNDVSVTSSCLSKKTSISSIFLKTLENVGRSYVYALSLNKEISTKVKLHISYTQRGLEIDSINETAKVFFSHHISPFSEDTFEIDFEFSAKELGFGKSWDEIIKSYRSICSQNSILEKQYRDFSLSLAPTIADPKIREIPFDEKGEKVVDLKFILCARIQMLADPKTAFEGPCFNSGLPNASKMRLSIFTKLQLMLKGLDELAHHFGYKPGQIEIRIFEGLRDLNTQKMLFEKKVKEIMDSNPELTLEMAEKETSKWVSPIKNNVPVHSTGAAIDIRLWDSEKKDFLDMGPFGIIWGINTEAPTFSDNITYEQMLNRLYCLIAAEKAGLTNYVYEYWHFSSGDKYAVYWKKQGLDRKALYGPVIV